MYLVEGDNGQLGIDVYNYLVGKYGMGYYDTIEESIFCTDSDGEFIQVFMVDVMFSIGLMNNTGWVFAILRSNGSVE